MFPLCLWGIGSCPARCRRSGWGGRGGGGGPGGRGEGGGPPLRSGASALPPCASPRLCRDIRALRESLSPLSLRESLSPCPRALPPCLRGVCPFRLLGNMPGAAAPMAARGSLICVRFDFCSQIRDLQHLAKE